MGVLKNRASLEQLSMAKVTALYLTRKGKKYDNGRHLSAEVTTAVSFRYENNFIFIFKPGLFVLKCRNFRATTAKIAVF